MTTPRAHRHTPTAPAERPAQNQTARRAPRQKPRISSALLYAAHDLALRRDLAAAHDKIREQADRIRAQQQQLASLRIQVGIALRKARGQ